MANDGETGVVVRRVMEWMLRRGVEKEPVRDYKGTHVFKARGGAWFMIGICLFCVGLFVWGLFDGSEGDVLTIVILVLMIISMLLLLRYSIMMLRSKIYVGPEMLVLDGAHEEPEHKDFWYWLKKESDVSLLSTPLVVEVPWDAIRQIKVENFELKIVTKANQHFWMPLGFFDMKVPSVISKYHEIDMGGMIHDGSRERKVRNFYSRVTFRQKNGSNRV